MKSKKVQKWLGVVGIFVTCMSLTGCGHTHEWQEATCTTPKTCTTCNETEGETLDHTWTEATCSAPKTCNICGKTEGESLEHTLTEANYQQAAACGVCGETVGEPLQADFEKYNFAYVTEIDKEYPFATKCYKSDDLTNGKIIFSDYQTFASDDTHEAKEGYEWKTVIFTIIFDDENAFKYGMSGYSFIAENFYDCSYSDDEYEEGEGFFTVNYNGETGKCFKEYECLKDEWGQKSDGTVYYEGQYKYTICVPAGFDGIVFSILSDETDRKIMDEAGGEVDSLEDVMLYMEDENTVSFRFM